MCYEREGDQQVRELYNRLKLGIRTVTDYQLLLFDSIVLEEKTRRRYPDTVGDLK